MEANKIDSIHKGPEPLAPPETSIIRIIVVIVIVLMVVLTSIFWYFFIRPISLEELSFREFKSGDKISVSGTITDVENYNTTYGPLTLLTLDDYENVSIIYKLVVDNDREYKIGEYYQTILHFKEYEFNGEIIVTAEELYLTYLLPILLVDITDMISFLGGLRLVQIFSDRNGTSEYKVFTANGDNYPLDMFNVSLRKGEGPEEGSAHDYGPYDHRISLILFAYEYLILSGRFMYNQNIDFMESLEDSISQNESIEFIDMNSNNLLDDDDIFKVYIPPTADKYSIESYYLMVGISTQTSNIAWGSKYIINWYDGAYEWFESYNLALSYVSTEANGALVDTSINITGISDNIARPFNQYNFSLSFEDVERYSTGRFVQYNLIEGSSDIVDNISVEYIDANKNTLLDVDDLLVIRGLENQTTSTFKLIDRNKEREIADIDWIAGYNHITGNLPQIQFEKGLVPGTTDHYRINVTLSWSHPQLAINSTLRLLITNNSSEIEPFDIPLRDGITESYNGTNVTFFDMDGDSYLSTNDYFVIECELTTTYYFKIFLFKKLLGSTTFRID